MDNKIRLILAGIGKIMSIIIIKNTLPQTAFSGILPTGLEVCTGHLT